MAGEQTRPYDDRELARRVAEQNTHRRALPGTRGMTQRLTEHELEYLRWLYAKVARDAATG